MNWTQKSFWLCGLSLALFTFGAQAQEQTMLILPDAAADQAHDVTQDLVLPDEAAEGMATAEANRANAADAAADGLAEAQANAASAAEEGLETAIRAVEGARGDLGRAHIPDGLPDQVPGDLPAGPDGILPDGTDLPIPPAPPTPPMGMGG